MENTRLHTKAVKNVEATKLTKIKFFAWNYVFRDSYDRGTILKINSANKFFQFITPDKDYGVNKALAMRSF